MQLDRREFLGALAVAAVATESRAQNAALPLGGPVLDCHLHGDGPREADEARPGYRPSEHDVRRPVRVAALERLKTAHGIVPGMPQGVRVARR